MSNDPPPLEVSSRSESNSRYITVASELDYIGIGRFHYLSIALFSFINAADAIAVLCVSYILPEFDASSGEKSFISASIFGGILIGGIVSGLVADRTSFGRRSTLFLSLVIASFCNALSALSTNVYVLAFFLVCCGIGISASFQVFSFASELLPSANRGKWLSYVAYGWCVGSLFVSLMAFIIFDVLGLSWKWFVLACSVPTMLTSFCVPHLPESPSFYDLRGDLTSAAASLRYIARRCGVVSRLDNGYHLVSSRSPEALAMDEGDHTRLLDGPTSVIPESESSPFIMEFPSFQNSDSRFSSNSSTEISPRVSRDEGQPLEVGEANSLPVHVPKMNLSNIFPGGGIISHYRPKSSLNPIMELFHPQIRRQAILLCIVWFCLSLGFYGIQMWTPTLIEERANILSAYQGSILVQLSAVPGNIISTYLMDRIGRKNSMNSSFMIAAAAVVVMAGVSSLPGEWSVLTCMCIMNAASTCTWNALDCLTAESFPGSVRSTAIGVLSACGRIGSIVGQFAFGALIQSNLYALLGTAGVVLLIGAVSGLFLPTDSTGAPLLLSLA